MKTAFIGHRHVFAQDIEDRLIKAIQTEIDNGCSEFTMGTHGAFDRLALSSCKKLRKTYDNLEIEVVITSLHTLERRNVFDMSPYADIKTVMFDIEHAYFKQQITLSNRQMIDGCTTLICYVDTSAYKSGAKAALRYAENKGLKIVNLYHKEDAPFYGKTAEEMQLHFQKFLKTIGF